MLISHELNKSYFTYRIQIVSRDPGRVRVTKLNSQQGSLSDTPPSNLTYQENLEKINSLIKLAKDNRLNKADDIKEFGEILFDVLFDSELSKDFVDFYHQITQDGQNFLRVELAIDEQIMPDLAALPWEFMRVPARLNRGEVWLGTDPKITFSRYCTQWNLPPPVQLDRNAKLKIALIVSTPPDENEFDYQPVQRIIENFVDGQDDCIELLPIVTQADRKSIDSILRHKPHIFHFLGHGRLENELGQEVGQLALTDQALEQAEWINADQFSNLFAQHCPRIVVLQACEGGAVSASAAFAGVASKIVQQNIPVVVAMQYSISIQIANRFIKQFYECIGKGYPVDVAVQIGRCEIALGTTQYKKRDFATPIIFMRSQDGHLFHRTGIETLVVTPETVTEIVSNMNFGEVDQAQITGNDIDDVNGPAHIVVNINADEVKNDTRIVGNKIRSVGTSGPMGQSNSRDTKLDNFSTPTSDAANSIPLNAFSFDSYIERLTDNFVGRDWVFQAIDYWLNHTHERFFLLAGEPGIGKSTIAARLVQVLSQDIVAYHFCRAGDGTTLRTIKILRSLAARLCKALPDYGEALACAIASWQLNMKTTINIGSMTGGHVTGVSIENIPEHSPGDEFDILIQTPLEELQKLYIQRQQPPPYQVIIIIDALDEAITVEGINIVNLLTNITKSESLPTWVRFILTSRLDHEVLRQLELLKPYDIGNSKECCDDIRDYVQKRSSSSILETKLEANQIETDAWISKIVERSQGNFLYAKLLLDGIEGNDYPPDNLAAFPPDLYGIYHDFLSRRLKGKWEYYHKILGLLAVARAPMTEKQLSNFTGVHQEEIRQKNLTARQFFETFEDEYGIETYTLFHQSFRDYLLSERHNRYFWCDAGEYHQSIVGYYFLPKPRPWHEHSREDYYLWNYLTYHLHEAGTIASLEQLDNLLRNPDWLQAKLGATDVNRLIEDYNYSSQDKALLLLKNAIQLSANTLLEDKAQLAGQLTGRLLDQEEPGIRNFLEILRAYPHNTPWLRPIIANLTAPNGCLLRTFSGHHKYVSDVALIPGKPQVISASYDQTLKLWDLNTGECLHTLRGHDAPVRAIAVVSNGQQVVSISEDNTLNLWDLETYEQVRVPLKLECGVTAMAVMPDQNRILLALNNQSLHLWDPTTGYLAVTDVYYCGSVTAMAVTPDSTQVLLALDRLTLELWDFSSARCLHSVVGHHKSITAVTIHPNGTQALSASFDQTLKLWDLTTGQHQKTLEGHTKPIDAVVVTSDGKYAISAARDRTLKRWNLKTGKCTLTLQDHRDWVNSVVVTSDGTQAISASDDQTLKLWNLQTEEDTHLLPLINHSDEICGLVVSPNGDHVISVSKNRTLKLWNPNTGELQSRLKMQNELITAIAVIPDSQDIVIALTDKTIKRWDIENDICCLMINSSHERGHNKLISALVVTPDGQRVISGSIDKTLKVWNLASGECEFTLSGHEEAVSALAITPDGQHVISGSPDKTLKVWNLAGQTCEKTLQGHCRSISAISITPDGTQIVSAEAEAEDFESNDDAEHKPLELKLWNLETGELQQTVGHHDRWIHDLAITPDGTKVMSVSADKTINLWGLATGKRIAGFRGESDFFHCAIAPDGKIFFAGDQEGRVQFFQVN